MARQVLAALALIFFVSVGIASAADNSGPAAAPSDSDGTTPDPFDETVIGNSDGSIDAAPVGGPVPNGVFPEVDATSNSTSTTQTPESGVAGLQATTVAGILGVAASFFF